MFDPDRYPFLEGRPAATKWRKQSAHPLPVDDRTMLHLLDALQTLAQGGVRMLLSYEALDVEEIGHVYEGLLDHTAVRITDTALALAGKHEPELPLGEIVAWAGAGDDTFVERLAKETGCSAGVIRRALATELTEDRRARLRAACGNDEQLLDRVAHYHALLREDLRGDPLVFLAGSLFVTQALDRRSSGTYYTPRELAEEVVRHALDPVAYDPGPAQERDPAKWKLKPADDLLNLKVADIAMGSGAFLVAACRYLAARLLEAWAAEGAAGDGAASHRSLAAGEAVPADPLERVALAHRLVAERCLYGVDKNPMAVEMAKLSLWLITLARHRPFSFVDHALRPGDSLLGVTDLRQLRVAHLDLNWHRQSSLDLGFHEIEAAVDRALELRRELEGFIVRDIPDAERKAQLLHQADDALADARLLGDLIVGAALAGIDDADPLIATEVPGWVRTALDPDPPELERATARTQLRALADHWLVEHRAAVGEVEAIEWSDRHPFHWALEFPEVSAQSGFDAIVGNPPFQGGKKISGALGGRYRDYLVEWLAGGVRGNADLVAYFYLRASQLSRARGGFGLIATNTIAQGDTREVGLDQLVEDGWTVHRAISSEPWPGGANLEMATVWARRDGWAGPSVLDRRAVGGITSALAIRSRVEGATYRLQENRNHAFIGSYVLGIGFVLSPDEAATLIAGDPRNARVVRPYLVGEDLNSRPDSSPSRWVIDFRDWTEDEARRYTKPFARVEALVKPERITLNERGYRERWWQFGRQGKDLYRAISSLRRCIGIAQTSRTMMPTWVPSDVILSHMLVVFAYDDEKYLGLLMSGFHHCWAISRGSTMRNDIRYIPTDCFETFPQPELTDAVGTLARELTAHRSALMLDRREGLTKTYNRLHDPHEHADDIRQLRELHVHLDHTVRDAYGWSELELGHGFHETRFGTRFTFAPGPRQEVLDLLLELNHERYAEEVRQGLHGKPKRKGQRKAAHAGAMTLELDRA